MGNVYIALLASFVYFFSKEGQEKSHDQLQAHANFFVKITKILLSTFFKQVFMPIHPILSFYILDTKHSEL